MLDRFIDRLLSVFSILALPLGLLLFLQWPLRDIVQAYSREANDLAQVIFALYVSAAITAASRQHGHLCTGGLSRKYPLWLKLQLERGATLLVLMPWAAYVIWAAWPGMRQSMLSLESFPDTYNPGFFVLKLSVGLLAALVLLQGFVQVFRHPPEGRA